MERWRNVKEYTGLYQVSTLGRVRSLPRTTTTGRILKKNKSRFYITVCLSKKNKFETVSVHRLIAKHFIRNPKDKPYVNHLDGNKFNNKLENLEWCTPSENKKHAVVNGYTYSPRGVKHWASKLTEKQVIEIRQKRNERQKVLAKRYKISIQTISDIINRKKWKHI